MADGRDDKLRSVADGELRGRGLRAPAWLEELVRTTPPPVPWRDVARFAVTLPAPLTVAVLVAGGIRPGAVLGAGVLATMGALAAALAPQPGPLRDQLRRTAAAVGFGGLGLLIGQYASRTRWRPVGLIPAPSGVAPPLRAGNPPPSPGPPPLLGSP